MAWSFLGGGAILVGLADAREDTRLRCVPALRHQLVATRVRRGLVLHGRAKVTLRKTNADAQVHRQNGAVGGSEAV